MTKKEVSQKAKEIQKETKEKIQKLWGSWHAEVKNRRCATYDLLRYSMHKIKEGIPVWTDLGFKLESDFTDVICNELHKSWRRLELMVERFSREEYAKYCDNILAAMLTHTSAKKQDACFVELEKNKFRTAKDKINFVREWGEEHCPEIIHIVQDRTVRRDDETQRYVELERKYLKLKEDYDNLKKAYDKLLTMIKADPSTIKV